jgi:hypothetical protein
MEIDRRNITLSSDSLSTRRWAKKLTTMPYGKISDFCKHLIVYYGHCASMCFPCKLYRSTIFFIIMGGKGILLLWRTPQKVREIVVKYVYIYNPNPAIWLLQYLTSGVCQRRFYSHTKNPKCSHYTWTR